MTSIINYDPHKGGIQIQDSVTGKTENIQATMLRKIAKRKMKFAIKSNQLAAHVLIKLSTT